MSCADLEIITKFREVTKRFICLQKDVLESTPLGLAEFMLLNVLDVNEKFSQTDLSDFCNIDKPATSRLIDKMHQQNLVKRNADDVDRRKTYISLSAKGKETLEALREKLLVCYENYFSKMDSSDKNTLIELLNKALSKGECKN